MVSRGGEDPDSINEQRIANYLHLVGFVLLFWDHFLTFPLEFKYLWKRSMKITTSLFFFIRYFTLLSNIIITVSLFHTSFSPASCGGLFIFREISLVSSEAGVCILLTLRIYAIYNCNVRVFVSMISFGAVLAGLALYALFSTPTAGVTSAVSLTPLGCHTNLNLVPHAVQGAAAWEALFIYDCLLFIMVIIKGYKTKRSLGTIPLLEIVLQDGSLYFAVMALANLANIFSFYFAGPFTRGSLSTFSSAISVTLICRLTLNLRANANAILGIQSRSWSGARRSRNGYAYGFNYRSGSRTGTGTQNDDGIVMSTLHFERGTRHGEDDGLNYENGPTQEDGRGNGHGHGLREGDGDGLISREDEDEREGGEELR